MSNKISEVSAPASLTVSRIQSEVAAPPAVEMTDIALGHADTVVRAPQHRAVGDSFSAKDLHGETVASLLRSMAPKALTARYAEMPHWKQSAVVVSLCVGFFPLALVAAGLSATCALVGALPAAVVFTVRMIAAYRSMVQPEKDVIRALQQYETAAGQPKPLARERVVMAIAQALQANRQFYATHIADAGGRLGLVNLKLTAEKVQHAASPILELANLLIGHKMESTYVEVVGRLAAEFDDAPLRLQVLTLTVDTLLRDAFRSFDNREQFAHSMQQLRGILVDNHNNTDLVMHLLSNGWLEQLQREAPPAQLANDADKEAQRAMHAVRSDNEADRARLVQQCLTVVFKTFDAPAARADAVATWPQFSLDLLDLSLTEGSKFFSKKRGIAMLDAFLAAAATNPELLFLQSRSRHDTRNIAPQQLTVLGLYEARRALVDDDAKLRAVRLATARAISELSDMETVQFGKVVLVANPWLSSTLFLAEGDRPSLWDSMAARPTSAVVTQLQETFEDLLVRTLRGTLANDAQGVDALATESKAASLVSGRRLIASKPALLFGSEDTDEPLLTVAMKKQGIKSQRTFFAEQTVPLLFTAQHWRDIVAGVEGDSMLFDALMTHADRDALLATLFQDGTVPTDVKEFLAQRIINEVAEMTAGQMTAALPLINIIMQWNPAVLLRPTGANTMLIDALAPVHQDASFVDMAKASAARFNDGQWAIVLAAKSAFFSYGTLMQIYPLMTHKDAQTALFKRIYAAVINLRSSDELTQAFVNNDALRRTAHGGYDISGAKIFAEFFTQKAAKSEDKAHLDNAMLLFASLFVRLRHAATQNHDVAAAAELQVYKKLASGVRNQALRRDAAFALGIPA